MRILIQYAKANWLYVIVAGYMLFSCILKIFSGINITIPCLIKTLFHRSCPGCGLTHAFIELLKLNPAGAWDYNPFIFLVLPAGTLFIGSNFLKFRKRLLRADIG
jgi:hypothetical protein